MEQVHGGVQPLDKLDRLQILLAAEPVRLPFACLFAVVEIQHGRERADAHTVEMELVKPEIGAGHQKAQHLGTLKVEQAGAP